MQTTLYNAIEVASNIFGEEYPAYRNVPLTHTKPTTRTKRTITDFPAIWTRDGLRPRWDNLAATAGEITKEKDLRWWGNVAKELSIPATILVSVDRFFLITAYPDSGFQSYDVTNNLLEVLKEQRERLFSPKVLSRFQSGQLSFADFEDTWGQGFSQYVKREQAELDRALTSAVKRAINEQGKTNTNVDTVFGVALAYMAARILEDKGYFGEIPTSNNDPVFLLRKTIERTNGFFRHAYNNQLPNLKDAALQALAFELGQSVSFALVDHRDIGRLYEGALKSTYSFLQNEEDEKWKVDSLLDLQQYYTPLSIAKRMLELLPLERIQPDERVVYDPAAGSGSLLIAATQRLSNMDDIALFPERENILSSNILGNDKDNNAHFLTKVRYLLIQETFGISAQLFPEPSYYGGDDYKSKAAWEDLPKRPRVIVANPPFKEVGSKNLAAEFVNLSINRLRKGDMFAFVLPKAFLIGTTHGWKEARDLIAEKCNILEIWQLPENIVGLSARQPVSIVLGTVDTPSKSYAISRSIISTSKAVTGSSQLQGFLGSSRIESTETDVDWDSLVFPKLKINTPTVRLDDLYYSCSGVTPSKNFPPIPQEKISTFGGTKVKKYWRNQWVPRNDLFWANPLYVKKSEQYILYGDKFLHRASTENEHIYDSPKVLVGRITNWSSRNPITAYIDTEGLCPNNHVYCIVPHSKTDAKKDVNSQWLELDTEDKLFWLLGLLNSKLVQSMSLYGRDTIHLNSPILNSLRLPNLVDTEIINIAKTIVKVEQEGKPNVDVDALRAKLNLRVNQSYGNPSIPEPVDYLSASQMWEDEQNKPCFLSSGQVMGIDYEVGKVCLYLNNLDDEVEEAWITLPQNLPAWTLDGTVFNVDIPEDVILFDDLNKRPWALQNFRHTPRPYLSFEDLQNQLLKRLGA